MNMTKDELVDEVVNLILTYSDHHDWEALEDAAEQLRNFGKPQPIEVLVSRSIDRDGLDVTLYPDGWVGVYGAEYQPRRSDQEWWRCTLTPIKRVK